VTLGQGACDPLNYSLSENFLLNKFSSKNTKFGAESLLILREFRGKIKIFHTQKLAAACRKSATSCSLPKLFNPRCSSCIHRCNFIPLKVLVTIWRRQDLVSGGHDDRGAEGASIDAPKAPSGVGYGEGCPRPSRLGGLGSAVSSPSGAPAAIAFSGCFRPQNASDSKKDTILLLKLQSIRKN